jgi:hypothetical protein
MCNRVATKNVSHIPVLVASLASFYLNNPSDELSIISGIHGVTET